MNGSQFRSQSGSSTATQKSLQNFTNFQEFIRTLRLRVFAAPHLLEELDYKKGAADLTKVIKKPSPLDKDDPNDVLLPEPEIIQTVSDTNIPDPALIEPDGSCDETTISRASVLADGSEFGNTDGIHIPYVKCGDSQIGVMIRKKQFPVKPRTPSSQSSVSRKKSRALKKFKKSRRQKNCDSSELGVAVCKEDRSLERETPSIIKKRSQTLDLLAKKGVNVVTSKDPKPERIIETCRKHQRTYTYEVHRKKYAVEVYDVDQLSDA
uniref:Uncharacterized protein n=1 Tax=Bursaphelenchus xylophilus TaxID=6326 RepID=A0A1I7S879_BURXY